jgi:chromosome segregation ATPase
LKKRLLKELAKLQAAGKSAQNRLKQADANVRAAEKALSGHKGGLKAAKAQLKSKKMQLATAKFEVQELQSQLAAAKSVRAGQLSSIVAERQMLEAALKMVDMVLDLQGKSSSAASSRRLMSVDAEQIEGLTGVSVETEVDSADQSFEAVGRAEERAAADLQADTAEDVMLAASGLVSTGDIKQAKAIKALVLRMLNDLKARRKAVDVPVATASKRLAAAQKKAKALQKQVQQVQKITQSHSSSHSRALQRLAAAKAAAKEAASYNKTTQKDVNKQSAMIQHELRVLGRLESMVASHVAREFEKKH